MAYKRLFLDSDVLLDMFLKREPFFFHTQILLIECIKRNIELRTSSLVIANIVYVLRKQIGILKAKQNLKNLFNSAKVLPFEFDAVETAYRVISRILKTLFNSTSPKNIIVMPSSPEI